jgi:hypothetical protein
MWIENFGLLRNSCIGVESSRNGCDLEKSSFHLLKQRHPVEKAEQVPNCSKKDCEIRKSGVHTAHSRNPV